MNLLRTSSAAVLLALVVAACGEDNADTPAQSNAPSGASATEVSAPASATASSGEAAGSSTSSSGPTTTVELAAELPDRTFISTSVDGYTLVEGTQITLTFEQLNLSANAGCNQMSSTWSLEGDVLVVPAMAMTQMACEPAAKMDQDTWLSAVLTSRPTLALDGETLTITAEGATVTLVDETAVAPSPSLEGTTWGLDSTVSGSTASSVPAGMRTPTLLFESGTVSVDTGCNRGTGSYQLGASTITFGPIATTRMACTDPAATTVEQTILSVLSGGIIWGIDGDTLSLRNGDTGLLLRPADASAAGGALIGPTWTLDSTVSGSTVTAVPAGAGPATLVFNGSTVDIDTGCNTGSGGYTVDGDQITWGPIAMTLRLCEDPAGSLETAIVSVLQGTTTFTVDGNQLTITAASGDSGLMYLAT